jgi:hypothetical protein
MLTCVGENFVLHNGVVHIQSFIEHVIRCVLIGQVKQNLRMKHSRTQHYTNNQILEHDQQVQLLQI